MRDYIILNDVRNVETIVFDFHFYFSCFQLKSDDFLCECFAIHKGTIKENSEKIIPLRFHSGCITSEALGVKNCDCAWQLKHAIQLIESKGIGMVIYMPWQEGRGDGLFSKIQRYSLVNEGFSIREAEKALGQSEDKRNYGPATALLRQLGIKNLKMITNNPLKIEAVMDAGIHVEEIIQSVMDTNDPKIISYLSEKKYHHNHLIEFKK